MSGEIDVLEAIGQLKEKLQNEDEKKSFKIVSKIFYDHFVAEEDLRADACEKFLVYFKKLKHIVYNAPKRIEIKATNEDGYEFKSLVVDLMLAYKKIANIENLVSEKKFTVPDGFEKAKQDFHEYQNHIAKVSRSIIGSCSETVKRIASENNIEIPSWFWGLVKKEDYFGFEPDFDYIDYALENSISLYSAEDDDELREPYERAVKSLEFLQSKVLKNSLDTLCGKWKNFPVVRIPKHVAVKNPETLLKLYDEAVGTYVSGNHVACIAMCRSLFEHILIQHYGANAKGKSDDNMDEKIKWAAGVYKSVNDLNLQDKRKEANKIIHNYNGEQIRDSTVLSFIKTVQSLIEGIPSQKLMRD